MVEVHLDLNDPQSHLVGVRLRCRPRLRRIRLDLPGWTPGSYLIRDYVRQLEQLSAQQDGQPLLLQRLGPASWSLELDPEAGALEIRYQVMATELSVRTCHVDAEHAFLALAAVVLELEGERWSPHHLSVSLPADWHVFTPLSGGPERGWTARDLDQLLDSPLEAGPHQEHRFALAGVEHRWVTWAGPAGADRWLLTQIPQLLDDVARVCGSCCALMGVERPAADHYLFVLHLLDEGYGGLEHDDSTVLVYGRSRLLQPEGYRRFLQLVAHEYLHQWNVRRLRPAELTPIDYHRPTPVPSLWFAEGVTSYFDQFLPLAAGLSDQEALLHDLGEDLSRYLLTPGRRVQSLRSSAQEAWVKLYKADAYAADSQVSYYLKGAVVALCLDLHLRQRQSSLPQVLQRLWRSHGAIGRGYSEADLLAAFAQACADLATLLPAWLNGLDDPDLDGYLSCVGVKLEAAMASSPWAGLTVAAEAGGVVAKRVWRHGPAERAGVMVGDELIAIDDRRLRTSDDLAKGLRPDVTQELLLCRRSQLRRLSLTPLPAQVESYRLVMLESVDAQTLQRREQWLRCIPVGAA